MSEHWKHRLEQAVPGLTLVDDEASLATYGQDWTKQYRPEPAAVVFPQDIDQVVAVVRFAHQHKVPIVPSGGRTGLSGGAVAQARELVLSCDKLKQLGPIDPVARSVRVGAGVITERLQQYVQAEGLFFPIDFASKGSSQIGGNLATNAGGIRVLRYGLMRDWVLGLSVVTGEGQLLELNRGLIKNASGYDLRHLMIGSEGTLGIIVEAILALAEPPPRQAVMLVAIPSVAALMQVFVHARQQLSLSAFEFFSALALSRVTRTLAVDSPLEVGAPYYALLEFDCENDDQEAAALSLYEQCLEADWLLDGVISQSEAQAQQLWSLREEISAAIAPETPYKNDISVPVPSVANFLQELDQLVARSYPNFEVVWFGHIGDGNLHLNVLKPPHWALTDFTAACERVNQWVFELVARYQGSISAEHGVGLLKRPYLALTRSDQEIAYMRKLKAVFDPAGILNPGKLIPE